MRRGLVGAGLGVWGKKVAENGASQPPGKREKRGGRSWGRPVIPGVWRDAWKGL